MCPLPSARCFGDKISAWSPGVSDYFRFLRFLLTDILGAPWLDQDTNCTFPWSTPGVMCMGFAGALGHFCHQSCQGHPSWKAGRKSWMILPFGPGFSGLVSIIIQWISPRTPLRTVHGCHFFHESNPDLAIFAPGICPQIWLRIRSTTLPRCS